MTSFDTRNYDYKNLSSLVKAIDLFQVNRGPKNSYLVKDIREKKVKENDSLSLNSNIILSFV